MGRERGQLAGRGDTHNTDLFFARAKHISLEHVFEELNSWPAKQGLERDRCVIQMMLL